MFYKLNVMLCFLQMSYKINIMLCFLQMSYRVNIMLCIKYMLYTSDLLLFCIGLIFRIIYPTAFTLLFFLDCFLFFNGTYKRLFSITGLDLYFCFANLFAMDRKSNLFCTNFTILDCCNRSLRRSDANQIGCFFLIVFIFYWNGYSFVFSLF